MQVEQIEAAQSAFAATLSDGFVVTCVYADYDDGNTKYVREQLVGTADPWNFRKVVAAILGILADGFVTWGHPGSKGSSRIETELGFV